MHQQRAMVACVVLHGLQRVKQHSGDPWIGGRLRLVFVGDELGLHSDTGEFADRLHHILDGRHTAVGQRHQPRRAHVHPLARRRRPAHVAGQRACPHVQHPFMLVQFPVSDIEGFVVDE